MKNILTFIITLFSSVIYCQTVMGTVTIESPSVASVYLLPSANIQGPQANNNIVSFSISISIDATGLAVAPTVTVSNALIPAQFTSVDNIEGRWVYTFAGNASFSMFTWTGGNPFKLMDITFPNNPTVNSKKPRLADYTNIGGGPSSQSYFYIDVNGTDYTNYADYFYNGNEGTTAGSTYVESFLALPIQIKSFSAIKLSQKEVKLNWTTSSEINSDYFGIERSQDNETWEVIGRVTAAGNSNIDINYEFLDNKLPLIRTKDQIFYYRLRLTDLDGKYAYSDVRGVNFGRSLSGLVTIYPNPTAQHINVDLSGIDLDGGNVELSVIDMNGRRMIQKNIIGNGIELIDVYQLPAATYNVVVKQGNSLYKQSIIKID